MVSSREAGTGAGPFRKVYSGPVLLSNLGTKGECDAWELDHGFVGFYPVL